MPIATFVVNIGNKSVFSSKGMAESAGGSISSCSVMQPFKITIKKPKQQTWEKRKQNTKLCAYYVLCGYYDGKILCA